MFTKLEWLVNHILSFSQFVVHATYKTFTDYCPVWCSLRLASTIGGVIIVCTNKFIMVLGFISWSASEIISSLNDYRKVFLNHMGNLFLLKYITCTIEMTDFTIHQKYQFSAHFCQFQLLLLIETIIVGQSFHRDFMK